MQFKYAPKIDLENVASKVKPGMLLCDDSVMSLVLRQRQKFEYRNFEKLKSATASHRARVNEAKTSVPSYKVI